MQQLLQISILPVVLTLLAFRAGSWIQQKTKSPLCNPILIAVILVLAFLGVSGMELKTYQSGATFLSWLMTPATVCLAISMYEQFQALRKNTPVILVGVAAGAVSCLMMVLGLSLLFGFDRELTASLLPKSVTSAIGVPLSQLSGGLSAVTTAAIAITGNLAAIIGPMLCKLFRLTDPVAQGVAYGTSGHVVGTSKASELGDLPAAAGSLSLVIAGILTAIIFPLLTKLI